MKSCVPNQQEIIQATDHVFQIMQLARNIPKDDE